MCVVSESLSKHILGLILLIAFMLNVSNPQIKRISAAATFPDVITAPVKVRGNFSEIMVYN